MNPLTKAERSQVSKRTWRERKRKGPKARDVVTGHPIWAGGMRYKGRPMSKSTAAALAVGIPPGMIGNPTLQVHLDNYARLIDHLRMAPESKFLQGKAYQEYNNLRLLGYLVAAPHEEIPGLGNPFRKRRTLYRGPRLPLRSRAIPGATKLNPYAYGKTGFRPPAAWFAKMMLSVRRAYKKLPGMTEVKYRAHLGQIIGGIWAKFPQRVRDAILKKYEPMAPAARALNPHSGICPIHSIRIPIAPEAKRAKCPGGHWLDVPE